MNDFMNNPSGKVPSGFKANFIFVLVVLWAVAASAGVLILGVLLTRELWTYFTSNATTVFDPDVIMAGVDASQMLGKYALALGAAVILTVGLMYLSNKLARTWGYQDEWRKWEIESLLVVAGWAGLLAAFGFMVAWTTVDDAKLPGAPASHMSSVAGWFYQGVMCALLAFAFLSLALFLKWKLEKRP